MLESSRKHDPRGICQLWGPIPFVEGWDNGSSPNLPNIAISRDEPLAHDEVQDLGEEALGVLGSVCHKHLQHQEALGTSQREAHTANLDRAQV